MGRGDNRRSKKMKMRISRNKKKARTKKRIEEAKKKK
jgi:hypothetical protein